MNKKYVALSIASVMSAFFAMGILDIIGIATNYVKVDFQLSDTFVGILSFMLFLSFLLFSVPTGALMNKIGQKKTVMLSILVMCAALSCLLISYTLPSVVVFFLILGVGITLIQVGLSPLLANIVSGKSLASALTFGQFVKALGSFLIPILGAWASFYLGSWRYLFPFLIAYSILSILILHFTPIHEQKVSKSMSMKAAFSLLGHRVILLSFLSMLCHVGLDVGMNIASPKLMVERVGGSIEVATYANSVYFLFRTVGCFLGSLVLSKVSHKVFYNVSMLIIILGAAGLFFADNVYTLYLCIGLVAIGNSNVYPIIVSRCMLYLPDNKNEVSALMVTGLFGGAIFPLIMGIASDAMNTQEGGLIVLSLGILYMMFWSVRVKEQ